jgi:hypothetical protein
MESIDNMVELLIYRPIKKVLKIIIILRKFLKNFFDYFGKSILKKFQTHSWLEVILLINVS